MTKFKIKHNVRIKEKPLFRIMLIRSNYANGNMNGVVHADLIPKVLIISTIIYIFAIVAVNRM